MGHQRRLGARRQLVKRPGEDLLSDAALAGDQHGHLGGRKAAHPGDEELHGRVGESDSQIAELKCGGSVRIFCRNTRGVGFVHGGLLAL